MSRFSVMRRSVGSFRRPRERAKRAPADVIGENGVMVPLPRFGSDVAADELESALREAGCAVVEGVAPIEQIDRITAELEPHILATDAGADEFTGRNTRRTGSLLARSRGFRDLAAHPIVLGALDRVLGDHAT